MKSIAKKRIVMGILLIFGLLLIMTWAVGMVQRPVLTILAPHDVPELGLPVFAQFVVTQSIVEDGPFDFAELRVPVYSPVDQRMPLGIRILDQGEVVTEWDVYIDQGAQEVVLASENPLQLSGTIEVQFDGSSFDHSQKESAPRVFVEKADGGYENGSYRIANNVKAGDVGLSISQFTTRLEVYMEFIKQSPLLAFAYTGYALLASIFLYYLVYAALYRLQ